MTAIRFDSIRAASLRVGDAVPAPLAWGGWNKSSARRITGISRDNEMIVFNLNCGGMFRSFPNNQIPVRLWSA